MTTDPKTEKVDEVPIDEQSPLYEAARRLMLASIGAIALAQEEIEDFIEKLIERGEIAEKEGRILVREMMAKRKKEATKAEDEFNKRFVDLLEKMNVPTKADIDALGKKITDLSKKVDELKKG